MSSGRSPVSGESWRLLKKDYADEVHGGNRSPILEVEGDLVDSIKTKNLKGDKIEIGVRGSQAPKADGHNQISEEAKAWAARTNRTQYKRRFIPDDNQKFNSRIEAGIERIVSQYRVEPEETSDLEEVGIARDSSPTRETPDQIRESIGVTTQDFFSDEVIEDLLLKALRRRDSGG